MTRIVVATSGAVVFLLHLTLAGEQPARPAAPPSVQSGRAATTSGAPPQSTARPKGPPRQPAASSDGPAMLPVSEQTALVKQYCVTCHSDRGKAGGLTLAA